MPRCECPIFPLQLVLFPGTPQLLHIFEPRYRQMLDDCMSGDRRFGISFVEPGSASDPVPAVGDVGCVAYVQAVRRLPDGRSNIVTVGQERYTIVDFVASDRLYRVAEVETFDDDAMEPAGGLGELGEDVRRRFAKFTAAIAALADQPPNATEVPSDPRAVSFHVAAGLDVDLRIKQELLALRSTRQRLERLAHLLELLNAELAGRVAVHVRARRNGKGGEGGTVHVAEES